MKPAARLLAITLALTAIWLSRNIGGAQPRQPNIVLIVADDLGYADIGVYGSRDIRTPNIDQLAAEGIRFTNSYVSGPYCSPTRAGLMTGRYPQRFGHEFNMENGQEAGLPLTETTMADRLKAAGYRTALFGKWHLGSAEKFHPMNRGFEEFFGFLGGGHSYLDVAASTLNPVMDGLKPAASVTYLTDDFTARAVSYIERRAAEPFFLYLAFNAAHTPMHATDKYLARFPQIADDRRRTYAAMVSALDDGVGRTLAALREQNLEQNTFVIFFNDNGGPTMPTTTINGANNGPLRGSKRQTWEGGIRVASILKWPGHLAAGRVENRPIIQLDVLPTALAAVGVTPDASARFDGVNLLPFLTGANRGRPHETLYWRLGGMMAIRKGDWKLVKTREGAFIDNDPSVLTDLSDAGLYNLADDIGESRNLASSHRAKFKELSDTWQQWNKQMVKPLWGPPRGRGSQ